MGTKELGMRAEGLGMRDEKSTRGAAAAGIDLDRYVQHSLVVDLDTPVAAELPAASARSLAFTLWLKSADFRSRIVEAAQCVRQVLVANPHTTLQVDLEPRGDPRLMTAELLEALLAASHESLSYLDWYYSLHPIRLFGAKRLVVLLPAAMKDSLDATWLDEIEDRATIHWG